MSDSAKSREYLVPAGQGEAELVEKRSRFIARVWPAETETAALRRLEETRQRHREATHNVYAYIIRDGATRYGDDGEPHGSAGLPTLKVFQSEKIFNVCCVVTRYFGGVLLGAGGLARAYSTAAKLALEQAGISLLRPWDVLLVPCPYPLYERLKVLAEACGGLVEASDFAAEVTMKVLLPPENTANFYKRVRDLSSGALEPVKLERVLRAAFIA